MLAKHKSFASSTKTTNRSYSKIKKNTKYSAKTNTKPAPETKPRVRQMLPRGFRKKTITASKTTLLFTAIRLNSPDGYNIEAKQVLRKKPARFQVDRSGTFELPNIPKIPVLLLTFVPPPPLTESILTDCRRLTEGEWFSVGPEEQLRSSNGMSPGGTNPDLYFSTTILESYK